jgi:FkbM family methyltransferase
MSKELTGVSAAGPTTAALPNTEQQRSRSLDVLRVLLRMVWPLTAPVRWYWLNSKRALGKKLLVDWVLKRFLPAPPAGFYAELPRGGRVFLHYREDIGLAVLMNGGFESAEIDVAFSHARAGTVVFDVGANVGMFTIPLAQAVGAAGRVVAFEPFPENVRRLEDNVRLNRLPNVEVEAMAVSDEPGFVSLHLGSDPAFHSTTRVDDCRDTGAEMVVRAGTLDGVWHDSGEPAVSFLKIDTEGGELSVLQGAPDLLATSRPAILVEAKGDDRIRELDDWLATFDYARAPSDSLAKGNLVYLAQ